jgi:hypothetical protein
MTPGPAAELRERIAAVRQRWFRAVALRTVARGAGAAAAIVLAGVAADRAFRPDGTPLIALALLTLAATLAAIAFVVFRMQPRPDDRHVARFIEERAAAGGGLSLNDAVVSAVGVVEDGSEHAGFSDLIVEQALRRLRDVAPEQVIAPAAMRRSAFEACGGTALVLVAAWLAAPPLSRAIDAGRLLYFPSSIALDVRPGNTRVAAGTPLRITASVRDSRGRETRATPKLIVSANGDSRTVDMRRTADGFEYAFESVDRSFHYVVAAGAAKSLSYEITALFAPRVRRIDLEYTYPSFTGLSPRLEEDGGDIYAPAGTRVRLRIRTDKPVARGEIATSSAASALRPAGDCMLEGELVLAKDDSYRLRLADDDGLKTNGETEYFIRLMDDRPPDVRILRPSGDQKITPLEEVAIEARADDDYGVAAFDLVYAVAGGREHVVAFDRVSGTDVEKVGARLLPAEDLGVKPGDVITYYARARDVARGKRSSETRSDIFFLEVKPFNEEFVAAQSQAGSGGDSSDVDALVAKQKEIISATWNIERRAAAGRSADDVAAVAKAQAELKAMAERMTRGGGRVRPPAPAPAPERVQFGAPQQRGGEDPVAAAVEAMGRAIAELEGQRTKDAIPHEMAALNGLLRAQAEVRRRQVSQGASGSGNGGNRSGQDLTALFDKELQRQQRTNYETRSSSEEKPKDAGDSALDRIRDLAKRQEDLSRRQRELAEAGLSPEEMKRQLEKLTREQMELRQQAEELARKQQSQPGANSSLQGAAEQMQSAASEMRRDEAKGAAESGARAAEQLRRAEEQMRGASGSGKGQQAGELQMEAQQVTQEQRRIASEAERLEKSQGSAADEARRRLAEEKERLAGRVDELQRAAKQQGQSGAKGKDAAAMTETAQALERERIAERMRASARAMKDPAQRGKEGAGAKEQELAKALERATGKLGGASADTKQLSEQLEQTRQIRERLNALEQQMRKAEAAQAGSRGRDGQQGRGGTSGDGQAGDLKKLQQDYQRELQRAKEALGRLSASQQRSGKESTTPEQEEFSRSAPGTEAFKQDRSGWESLRKEIDLSLEKYEASVSDRLARGKTQERLNGGGSDGVPESYRAWIARYYQSLAKVKK